VHPLALAPRTNDACPSQVGQVAGNLRLGAAKNLDEVANADFLVAHQVQQAQSGFVSQRLEKSLEVKVVPGRHLIIFALTNTKIKNIVALAYMFWEG
jgi:hypothetical protein